MERKAKILLGIFIPIIVIGGSLGGFALYQKLTEPKLKEPPILDFPVANPDVIDIIWGYGIQDGEHHNGIDFGCNTSVDIIVWCDLTVIDINTFYNDAGGHWQTNIFLEYDKKFEFVIAFESWALNETYANIQADAINVEEGRTVFKGEILGKLLYHGSGTHIHWGMYEDGQDICGYQYFSAEAKVLFLELWEKYGWGDDSYYDDQNLFCNNYLINIIKHFTSGFKSKN